MRIMFFCQTRICFMSNILCGSGSVSGRLLLELLRTRGNDVSLVPCLRFVH
ncbi:hypothetical protein HanRHA438_Chr13g0616491 [Helianthus annuus]|nr:hypothetical protein HanRHA438_Chr13g0616491 [Helianthus annuus]